MAIIKIINGGEEISLSIVRPHRMEVPQSRALDICESLYLIVCYLLSNERKNLSLSPIIEWLR